MKKLFAILIALLLLVASFPALAAGERDGNLIANGDFLSVAEGANLPLNWKFEAYDGNSALAGIYEDEAYGRCLGIESTGLNDARIYQDIAIKPGKIYRISAMVRASNVSGHRGACLSIDNYSIDETYCYSADLSYSTDWTPLSMLVKTGPEQRSIRVALRLGGYGTTARGSAWFCQVTCEEAVPLAGESPIDLMTEYGAPGTVNIVEEPKAEGLSSEQMFYLMLLAFAFALLMGTAAHWYLVRREDCPLETEGQEKLALALLLSGAFLARLILSLIFYGHSTDINCFMAWGNAMLNGPAKFYTSGMFADYPPGYMYICGLLAAVGNLLGLTYGSAGYAFLFKLPATFADLFSAVSLYRYFVKKGGSRGFGLVLAAFVCLNPVLMFVSGAWGQIDSVLALCLVGVLLLLENKKMVWAGALFGLGILLKPQALMAGPLFAVLYIREIVGPNWKENLVKTCLAVVSAFGVILLLALPFWGDQDWNWLFEKYFSTTSSYPYASVEAFNVPALLGGNWASVENRILGLPFKAWGILGILFAVVSSALLHVRARRYDRQGLGALTTAYLLAVIFTFGHFMHERYLIPVLLLLLFAYAARRDRRILIPFLIFSASILLNVLAAMYIVDHQQARGQLYQIITFLGSLFTLLGTLSLMYTAFAILWKGEALAPLPLEKKERRPQEETLELLSLAGEELPKRWSGRERLALWGLVAIYSVFQLTNLGTTKVPQTVYYGREAGETLTVVFDREAQVEELWVYGNIANNGNLTLSGSDGAECHFEQLYDNMFRWQTVDFSTPTDRVELTLTSGQVAINEIAFLDGEGRPIPASILEPQGTQSALVDEQHLIPESPSYLNGMYLDELYHGRTAYEHLHNLSPYENSHPPLGKIFIMLGIILFGMSPFGWRVVGALFGIGMLPVFYALARRILKNQKTALAATALFAFDFMHFTQTRIATIDVYAVFFILVMYYFMYRYMTVDYFQEGYRKSLKPLGLCGIFFGIGAACKWTCFYAGAGLAVLFFATLISRYQQARKLQTAASQKDRAAGAAFPREAIKTLLFCCVFFILIPLAIYFASYIPYYRYEAGQNPGYGFGDMCRTFWKYQDFMYSYHSGLDATHPYQSTWYEWPFTVRPMWYYFSGRNGQVSTISASGNPAVWWISTLGAIALYLLRGMKLTRPHQGLFLIGIGILANYLPWVLVPRCTFIYHFFGTVPFILLASMYLVQMLEEKYPALRPVKWVWTGLGILFFLLLYPGLSGLPVSPEWGAFLKKLPGGILMYGA